MSTGVRGNEVKKCTRRPDRHKVVERNLVVRPNSMESSDPPLMPFTRLSKTTGIDSVHSWMRDIWEAALKIDERNARQFHCWMGDEVVLMFWTPKSLLNKKTSYFRIVVPSPL
ncbi:hypothetical protein AVEN_51418-1 [Araneus ventricosus]|uniref:Uncharacterized protein n=1 Tax=Araneus ventricosus TaxID=182803 RepID=A0A4Y2N6X5_ARAVE|nr:hypothetical protein AVEN_51418-1 [Araneus ventricosus]